MKLPASLLSAIVIGIALQGTVACTKSKEDPTNKTAEQQAKEKKKTPVDPCPACGMG